MVAYGIVSLWGIGCLAQEPAPGQRISRQWDEFAGTRYLSEEVLARAKEKKRLIGNGEADYEFTIPADEWYVLYVSAAQWATELLLDGKPLIYTPFASGVWDDKDDAKKVLNLYLTAGQHTLTFSRTWHPGLPWMSRFFLEPAGDITDRVRLTTVKDHLVFRRGEDFSLTLQAGKGSVLQALHLKMTDVQTGEVAWNLDQAIPAGQGNLMVDLQIPTDKEGIFDLLVTDDTDRPAGRVIQFCVIDTAKPDFPDALAVEHLYSIDCANTVPDYQQGETRVTEGAGGCYRESGDRGREKGVSAADWFAYTLNLPTIQEPYLLEIEYPDDDERVTPIVLVEQEYGPPEPGLGYFSGGAYPLSNTMQTQQFFFFPRSREPRLLFYNWCTGLRSAVAKIHINRVKSGFPGLRFGADGRAYGMYQEEPLRYLCNFGAMPAGDEWPNLYLPAQRAAQLMNYAGTNLWHPTIAVYQAMLWPGTSIPGYQIGILPPGPSTLKEPIKKDIMRMMLLVSEKYGLDFVGDLHIPANARLMGELDERFGGNGSIEDDGVQKPWLVVSNKGEAGLKSPHKPYYNALYPGVQEWTADVFRELVKRYAALPAFRGLSIRFMGWSFSSWQCLPSITWGYGDYTVSLFEQETGIEVPVPKDDPKRFGRRYEYLMRNQRDEWIRWRNRKMFEYHTRLAAILTEARPDLKLYLYFTDDGDYAETVSPDDRENKGWAGILKETAIDLELYRSHPSIVAIGSRGFPDGGNRGQGALKNAARRDASAAVEPLRAQARNDTTGSLSALFFGTNHEGPYVRFDKLGYPKEKIQGNKQTIYPDATVYPAGIHYLERFANAMADANMTWLCEGSHGYGLGQPQYLRDFLAEYRSLPVMGMQMLGQGDPVALWHATHEGRTYFYVVNRTWYSPVETNIIFDRIPQVVRLTTGDPVIATGNSLTLSLGPYEMIALAADAVPRDLSAVIPSADRDDVQKMLDSARQIVDRQPEELTVIAISPGEMGKAKRRLADAAHRFEAGSYWRCRQALIHSDLIKVYEALNAYPVGLFHRKSLPVPEGALPADALKGLAREPQSAAIVEASSLAAGLGTENVLVWENGDLELSVEIPYTGLYRIWYAYPLVTPNAGPLILADGTPVTDFLPLQQAGNWERKVSMPLALTQGNHLFTVRKTTGLNALQYLYCEPTYRDLTPECFVSIGPFEGVANLRDSEKIYETLNAPLPGENALDLSAEYVGLNGRKVRWVTPEEGISSMKPADKGYIDLYKTFGVMSHVVTCTVTQITCPEERAASLRFGADYWARIVLNGDTVFLPETRPKAAPAKGEVTVPITLVKGVNTLAIRNHAGSAGNGFWLAITDPGDLTVAVPGR